MVVMFKYVEKCEKMKHAETQGVLAKDVKTNDRRGDADRSK